MKELYESQTKDAVMRDTVQESDTTQARGRGGESGTGYRELASLGLSYSGW